jgi:hypothetical protein
MEYGPIVELSPYTLAITETENISGAAAAVKNDP